MKITEDEIMEGLLLADILFNLKDVRCELRGIVHQCAYVFKISLIKFKKAN